MGFKDMRLDELAQRFEYIDKELTTKKRSQHMRLRRNAQRQSHCYQ